MMDLVVLLQAKRVQTMRSDDIIIRSAIVSFETIRKLLTLCPRTFWKRGSAISLYILPVTTLLLRIRHIISIILCPQSYPDDTQWHLAPPEDPCSPFINLDWPSQPPASVQQNPFGHSYELAPTCKADVARMFEQTHTHTHTP